ncbi:hypothetical protein PVL29_011346 [Vitis rotundifolia]|uniref:Oxidative stress 3 n=1 Tax=Vitis rotundifolia TaxID=103349 RepID=A0AA39DPF2_VITRO|nr:hypothetical protein PVL29_011346 [Vitis rotundifolia]
MAKSDHIQVLGSPCSIMIYDHEKGAKQRDDNWVIMEADGEDDDSNYNPRSSSSSLEDSITSHGSSASSSDLVDDASSPSTSYSSVSPSHSSGPLYELSELMAQLPIKRGLSKYYEGKSQSFTSLSSVRSIEDLAKKESPYRRKMKACKSYGGGLDTHKAYTLPRAIISKKRGSAASLSLLSRRGSFVNSCRPPMIPVQKNL